MLIKGGQVHRVVEGTDTILELARSVKDNRGRYMGFPLNIISEDGLQPTAFDPVGEIVVFDGVTLLSGEEFGSGLSCELLLFTTEPLKSRIGPMLLT